MRKPMRVGERDPSVARSKGKTNKADLIVEALRYEIATGARPPGSLLPPEAQLTQSFGVSRPSHREALRVLESEGLIRVARGRGGAEVLMPPLEPVARWVGVYLQMGKEPFEALMEARKVYEPPSARAIAERQDQVALAALAQCASAQEFSIHDRSLFHRHEAEFVRILIANSGNPVLELIGGLMHGVHVRAMRNISRRIPHMEFAPDHLREGVRAKQGLVRLMAKGDAEGAARAWVTYISIYQERVFSWVPRDSLIEMYAQDEPPAWSSLE